MLHVGFEPPRHRAAAPDHAVLGDSRDEDDLRHARSASRASAAPLTRTPVHSSSISAPSDL